VYAAHSGGRFLERLRVRQLSAEIKPTQKAEHFAERGARFRLDLSGDHEIRAIVEEKRGTLPATARG
jgi:hypothetical protein